MKSDGFERLALGDLFDQRSEKGLPGLPTLAVTIDRGIVRRDSLSKKMETSLGASDHLLVRKGDIAYNMMRMWQGASGLAGEDGLLSPSYVVCSPRQGVSGEYFAQLFRSPRMIKRFSDFAYGLTSDRLRLYFREFSKIRVEVPPYHEQCAIADTLKTWDSCIELIARKIGEHVKLRDTLISALLLERHRLSGFRGAWSECDLGSLARFLSGGTPSRNRQTYWGGNIPWITARDLGPIWLSDSTFKVTDLGARNGTRLVPPGTVFVLVRGMTLLRDVPVGVTRCEATFNQDIKALVCSEVIRAEFLALALLARKDTLRRFVDRAGHGTGRLQTDHLRTIRIRFPQDEEQAAIVEAVALSDRNIDLLQHQLELFKKQKRGLMQKLLTGQIRLPT